MRLVIKERQASCCRQHQNTVNSTGKGELPRERCVLAWCFCLTSACTAGEDTGSQLSVAALVRTGESQLFVSLFLWGFPENEEFHFALNVSVVDAQIFPSSLSQPQLSPPSSLTLALQGRIKAGEIRKSPPRSDSSLALVKCFALGDVSSRKGRGGEGCLHPLIPPRNSPQRGDEAACPHFTAQPV